MAIVLVVAGALAITVVLPAKYTMNTLGTGRWLGLVRDAPPVEFPVQAAPAAVAAAPVQNGPVGTYGSPFNYDVFEITLQPYEFVEYKYQLAKGAHMLFVDGDGLPAARLHAEREGDATGAAAVEESYDKAERREAHAGFIAPFSGIHRLVGKIPAPTPSPSG